MNTIENRSFVDHLAWLPNNDTNYPELETLEESAVDWLVERADAANQEPVVFINAKKAADGFSPPFSDLIRRHGCTYPLDRSKPRQTPVLCLYPDARSLRMAMEVARRSSLLVIESVTLPLHGWAAATGATDITGLHVAEDLLAPEARAALNRTLFFTGNNNWTGSRERSHAKSALRAVVAAGLLDADTAAGYVLGHGRVAEHGAKNIAKIVGALSK
ncbi:hypothetical protein LTI14_04340 [Nesterenkonia sp. YGD6]|uniref:hypothetical protein n=1 Tax=Nesterenkonia sp. YGD6 TaxID=2901231 RepID=UPI001F4CA4C4|nr:hypothetical protein [Nesterenkonia sp. YGD6]MCH8562451.1 hypothetical protein [Nesterenkonia sp. YGD6]